MLRITMNHKAGCYTVVIERAALDGQHVNILKEFPYGGNEYHEGRMAAFAAVRDYAEGVLDAWRLIGVPHDNKISSHLAEMRKIKGV